jgi:hypothetical protein
LTDSFSCISTSGNVSVPHNSHCISLHRKHAFTFFNCFMESQTSGEGTSYMMPNMNPFL